MGLVIGEKVPQFIALDQNNNYVSDQLLLGQKYILFFYGQDDTPTCTKQVCAANSIAGFANNKGFKIYGVSPDKTKKHQKFISKFNLSFDLLSDPEKKMMYAFEAYGPKIFMGKEVVGVYRKTYFINEEACIIDIINEVTASLQGQQILEKL